MTAITPIIINRTNTQMIFSTDNDIIDYIEQQLNLITNGKNNSWKFHVRVEPGFHYDQKSTLTDLEWKIFKNNKESHYISLRITSDYKYFLFEHSNHSGGPFGFHNFAKTGTILETKFIDKDELSLSKFVQYILDTKDLNYMDWS